MRTRTVNRLKVQANWLKCDFKMCSDTIRAQYTAKASTGHRTHVETKRVEKTMKWKWAQREVVCLKFSSTEINRTISTKKGVNLSLEMSLNCFWLRFRLSSQNPNIGLSQRWSIFYVWCVRRTKPWVDVPTAGFFLVKVPVLKINNFTVVGRENILCVPATIFAFHS